MQERYPDIQLELTCPDREIEMDEAQQTAAFRIFQQALANSFQHAQPTNIKTLLTTTKDYLILTVSDNGNGFLVPESWIELARTGHLGIVGMTERAASVGGVVDVSSAPGHGTTVEARFPLIRPDTSETE